jgi:hypothetical protein
MLDDDPAGLKHLANVHDKMNDNNNNTGYLL